MVQVPTKPLTLDEFLALPETKPASEYIDGTIIQKPMPQGKHSVIQRELSFALTAAFRSSKTAQAFPELRCTFGGRSLVPDIAVFRTSNIPRESNGDVANAFKLPPDWTIEILSPGQKQTKVIRNILHCLNHGTEMGWIIDPDEFCIFVYAANQSVQFFDIPELDPEIETTDAAESDIPETNIPETEAPEAEAIAPSPLPVPEFAQAVQLTVDEVFGWLKA
jgi:Uma2 family endonuclease